MLEARPEPFEEEALRVMLEVQVFDPAQLDLVHRLDERTKRMLDLQSRIASAQAVKNNKTELKRLKKEYETWRDEEIADAERLQL